MSDNIALHQRILLRFCDSFGDPVHAMGRAVHWSLRPCPYRAPINVMVNIRSALPAVWIFDPHDGPDDTICVAIKVAAEIEEAILSIRDRVQRAAMRPGHTATSPVDLPSHQGKSNIP